MRPRTGWEKQLLLHRAGQRASHRLSTSYWGHRSAGPASSSLSPALAGVRPHAPTPYLQRVQLDEKVRLWRGKKIDSGKIDLSVGS